MLRIVVSSIIHEYRDAFSPTHEAVIPDDQIPPEKCCLLAIVASFRRYPYAVQTPANAANIASTKITMHVNRLPPRCRHRASNSVIKSRKDFIRKRIRIPSSLPSCLMKHPSRSRILLEFLRSASSWPSSRVSPRLPAGGL